MYNYNNNRIIAIGDIHGDYYIFIELLKMAKVIDSKLNWIGNNTYVIQLGDTLDGKRPDLTIEKTFLNTPDEIKINNFIIDIDNKAKQYNGRVISILGNHELYPYYFYNDKIFNRNYVKTVDIEQYKKLFNISRFEYYKPGKGPGAKLFGKTRPLIIQLGKFIFCHGSLSSKFLQKCIKYGYKKSPNSKKVDLDKINKDVKDWLIGNNKNPPFFINDNDNINPLFNRDLTTPKCLTEFDCKNLVEPIFEYLTNAKFIVMGHSTHKKINTLCNNSIYRTDIAISRAFGGTLKTNMKRLQVLEIKQSKTRITTNIITPEGKISIL